MFLIPNETIKKIHLPRAMIQFLVSEESEKNPRRKLWSSDPIPWASYIVCDFL